MSIRAVISESSQLIYRCFKSFNRCNFSQRLCIADAPVCSGKKNSSTQTGFVLPETVDTRNSECVNLLKSRDIEVITNFISEEEEQSLLKEVEPYLARLRYENAHWDDAINGYRETERSSWNESNRLIIEKIKLTSFSEASCPTAYVHVLDLAADGVIKPHKDSVRYCGDTISGISLLSDSVMKLAKCNRPDIHMDILLKQRSLYIIRNSARYDYTHEILHNSKSTFKCTPIVKGRRISIICRNNPNPNTKEA